MKELSILLEFKDQRIPSVNSIYTNHRYKRGLKVLTPEARLFRELINRQLDHLLKDQDLSEIKKIQHYKLYFEFVLKRSFKSRDYDNMVKLVQDSLFTYLGENDAKIVHGEQLKFNRDRGGYEFIYVHLSESSTDINKYNK